jgi:hypothetical protein
MGGSTRLRFLRDPFELRDKRAETVRQRLLDDGFVAFPQLLAEGAKNLGLPE